MDENMSNDGDTEKHSATPILIGLGIGLVLGLILGVGVIALLSKRPKPA